MKKEELRKHGIILSFLFTLCNKASKLFRASKTFGFLSASKDDKGIQNRSAICYGLSVFAGKCRKNTETVRKYVSRLFERSFMLRWISAMLIRLINLPGRVFGAFGLTWGAYVMLIYLIKSYALNDVDQKGVNLIIGIVAFIASIPILFTDKSICRMAKESWFISNILDKIFGIPDDVVKPIKIKKCGQSGAVIAGILLGLSTYFISPLDIVICTLCFVLTVLILSYPEGGVVIAIAVSPLLGLIKHSSIVLAAIVLVTAFSYFIKVLRGKRVFRLESSSLAFYAFMAVVFLSGFAPGSANTLQNALLCCALMLIFPLIVNLMTNKRWLNSCIVALVLPSAIVAFVGIAQYFLGLSPSGWVDNSLFSSITSRTVSVFNNPNILGVYLAAMFPMSLMITASEYDRKIKLLGVISSSYIAIATIFTYSRSAWLALAVGALLFAVAVSPKGILLVIPAGIAAVALALIFPDTIGSRLVNFFSLSDSANNYRIDVWNSSWDLLKDTWLYGIGWGEEAFRTAYSNYSSLATQYAMHSHSLYMQIVIHTGLIGLVVFAISVILIIKKCISSSINVKSDASVTLSAKAALCGALAIMIAGLFDYTWYNFRVFFVFCVLLAFTCAASNIKQKSDDLLPEILDADFSYVTVSIPMKGEANTDNRREL